MSASMIIWNEENGISIIINEFLEFILTFFMRSEMVCILVILTAAGIIGTFLCLKQLNEIYGEKIIVEKVLKKYEKNGEYVVFQNYSGFHLDGLFHKKYGFIFLKAGRYAFRTIKAKNAEASLSIKSKNRNMHILPRFFEKFQDNTWSVESKLVEEKFKIQYNKALLGTVPLYFIYLVPKAKIKIMNKSSSHFIVKPSQATHVIEAKCRNWNCYLESKYLDILRGIEKQ